MSNYNYNNLSPFKWFVLENFPFIEADFDAITNYQLYSKVVEYLNQCITNVNDIGEQMETVTNQMIALQQYVDNYFDNLDVQEEINNKLDDLVEDGTLMSLIGAYTQPQIDEQNERIENFENQTNANISNMNTKINKATSGSPLVASDITGMTDTTRIYVNTSNGHWYWYNGNTWVDGGVYQASEDSTTISELQENFIKSINLYKPNNVELEAITDGAGTWQKFTINNPIYGHKYCAFDKLLYTNFNNARFQQYHDNEILSQYSGSAFNDHPILENCNKLVLININSSSSIPLDIMILDMENKQLSDITEFIDSSDTLNQFTHLKNIEPNELKGSIPYNLYNPNNIIELDGTYQRSALYNSANKTYGFYCFVNGELKRLTQANFGHYLIGIAYGANKTVIQRFNNPSDDITVPNNTTVFEINITNDTNIPFDNIMIIDKSLYNDNDINEIGYLPYSYFLDAPFFIKEAVIDKNTGTDVRPYSGKKILSLGDSFTFMNYYGEKLQQITGCEQTPRGYNGGNIGVFVSDRYTPTGGGGEVVESPFTAELLAPYDIITVMGGTNNYGRSMPLGTINDEPALNTSVCAEVKRVIDKILTLKPSIKIIWCTEPYRIIATETAPSGYLPNQAGYTMEEMNEKIIEICRHYGIPVFDFYHNSNWNNYTVKYDGNNEIVENIYTYDGLHPKSGSGNGGELLGISFGNFINSI